MTGPRARPLRADRLAPRPGPQAAASRAGSRTSDGSFSRCAPGNADMKYPWELSRSQHWVTLAQAWQLTRESRFAVEIARELDDFVEANPVGIGINWTCTMDVAIRAANWCLAFALIHDCAAIDADAWRRAYAALYDHAEFIFSNLENKYEVTSNHFLSNVVGLHVLAAAFTDIGEGTRWDAWCRAGAGDRNRRAGARGGGRFRSRPSPIIASSPSCSWPRRGWPVTRAGRSAPTTRRSSPAWSSSCSLPRGRTG